MKIVREDINFERGNPRDTLKLRKDKLDEFPDTRSFIEYVGNTLPSEALDPLLINVKEDPHKNLESHGPHLTWLMPIKRTSDDKYLKATNCAYILLMNDSDGLQLEMAEVHRKNGPSIPFKEVGVTSSEWEANPDNVSNVIGWIGWDHYINSRSDILTALHELFQPNWEKNWSYL